MGVGVESPHHLPRASNAHTFGSPIMLTHISCVLAWALEAHPPSRSSCNSATTSPRSSSCSMRTSRARLVRRWLSRWCPEPRCERQVQVVLGNVAERLPVLGGAGCCLPVLTRPHRADRPGSPPPAAPAHQRRRPRYRRAAGARTARCDARSRGAARVSVVDGSTRFSASLVLHYFTVKVLGGGRNDRRP